MKNYNKSCNDDINDVKINDGEVGINFNTIFVKKHISIIHTKIKVIIFSNKIWLRLVNVILFVKYNVIIKMIQNNINKKLVILILLNNWLFANFIVILFVLNKSK